MEILRIPQHPKVFTVKQKMGSHATKIMDLIVFQIQDIIAQRMME